jgi:hypothetical protein
LEVRVLRCRAASPEEVDFPCVEQVALLRRHLRHHKPETVALVTSLPPRQLDAAQWLADNRAAWGIENGLHLRLDVSHLEDQCRVRLPKSMRVMGRLRRFSNSLFLHWRSRQTKPKHKTTTDFFTAMNAEHHRYAIRCLHARQPSFQTAL